MAHGTNSMLEAPAAWAGRSLAVKDGAATETNLAEGLNKRLSGCATPEPMRAANSLSWQTQRTAQSAGSRALGYALTRAGLGVGGGGEAWGQKKGRTSSDVGRSCRWRQGVPHISRTRWVTAQRWTPCVAQPRWDCYRPYNSSGKLGRARGAHSRPKKNPTMGGGATQPLLVRGMCRQALLLVEVVNEYVLYAERWICQNTMGKSKSTDFLSGIPGKAPAVRLIGQPFHGSLGPRGPAQNKKGPLAGAP